MTIGIPIFFFVVGVVFNCIAKLVEDIDFFLIAAALCAAAGYVLAAFSGLMYFLQ